MKFLTNLARIYGVNLIVASQAVGGKLMDTVQKEFGTIVPVGPPVSNFRTLQHEGVPHCETRHQDRYY